MKGTEAAAPALINTPLSALTAPAAPAVAPVAIAGAVPGEQKSTVDAPQVQNLDGTITRPLIKGIFSCLLFLDVIKDED